MEPIEYIQWRDEYNSGIQIIDRQHKAIVKALNDIYTAFAENKNVEEKMPELLRAFDAYATTHHNTEEAYAEKYGFPKTQELKESHNYFMATYKQLKSLYEYQGQSDLPKMQYIKHLHAVMSEWLMFHFATLDRELFEFLREKKAEERS